jgi:hypothetical protein
MTTTFSARFRWNNVKEIQEKSVGAHVNLLEHPLFNILNVFYIN